MGAFSIGVLNMQSQEEGAIAANNDSVVRVRHDLFSRSSVGGIFTNRSSGDGSFNRTAGVDTRLLLSDNFTLEGFFMRSATPGVSEDQDAYHVQGLWSTDLWDLGAGHMTLEPNFNSELGFKQRRHNRKTIGDIAFKPRPNLSWLRQVQVRAFFEYFTNQENVVESKVGHYPVLFRLESGDTIRIGPHTRFERLSDPLELAPGVIVPPGDYQGVSVSFTYTMDPSRPLAGMVRHSFQRSYFGGSRSSWVFNPQWKPTPALILDLNYDLQNIHMPEKHFYSHIINAGANYSLNTRLITSAVFQYNNTAQVKGVNLRLNYIYRPGDDLFVVYRDTRNQLNPDFNDRAVLVKFTHSLDM